jgi:hypothetical protein
MVRQCTASIRTSASVLCATALLLATLATPASAQDHRHEAGDVSQLGRVVFPISCGAAVQPRFERAVAMLHSFWFEAADWRRSPRSSRRRSVVRHGALGTGHDVTGQPDDAGRRRRPGCARAWRRRERAAELAAASARASACIDAVLAYYADHEGRNHAARMQSLRAGAGEAAPRAAGRRSRRPSSTAARWSRTHRRMIRRSRGCCVAATSWSRCSEHADSTRASRTT